MAWGSEIIPYLSNADTAKALSEIDRQLATTTRGIGDGFGGGYTSTPSANYVKQYGTNPSSNKDLKLFKYADSDVGIFADSREASKYLSFDKNGNIVVRNVSNDLLSNAAGNKNAIDNNELKRIGDSIAKESLAKQYISGSTYSGRLNSDAINTAFQSNKPMGWGNYVKALQDTLSAETNDGSMLYGGGIMRLMKTDQQFSTLSDMDKAYSGYLSEYEKLATDFVNGQVKAQQDASLDAQSSTARKENADYSVKSGYNGLDKNSALSATSFNDSRRLGWGQSGIQGV